MKFKLIVILYFIIAVQSINLYSQCSDAGICIIGKKDGEGIEHNLHIFSMGFSLGSSGKNPDVNGELNDLIFSTLKVEGSFDITNNTQFGFSLPYIFISGPLGDNSGIGDLSILFNKNFPLDEEQILSLTAGGKFATGKVNLPAGKAGSDNSFPQRYQPGLGTNDLLVGINYDYNNFNASVAYQKPFGRSKNNSTRLKRGDDILLRVGYNQTFSSINLKGELLTIIRLQPSSILDTTKLIESFIEIDGSNEMQVNFLATINYKIWNGINLQGQIAVPFLKRDYNYDGLKRSFTFTASIIYNFTL